METVWIEPRDVLRCDIFGFAYVSRGCTACIGYSLCGDSDLLLFQISDVNFRKRLTAIASRLKCNKGAAIDFLGCIAKKASS